MCAATAITRAAGLALLALTGCTPAARTAPTAPPSAAAPPVGAASPVASAPAAAGPPAGGTAPAASAAATGSGAPAGAAGTAVPAERVAINMPYAGRGVAGLAHYVAVEEGIYARHGVDVTSPNIGNPPTLVAAVLSGEAPVASNALEPTIHAAASGAEIVVIASNLKGIAMSIIAQPSIRTPEDLRGKRMGVTAYASPTHTGAVLYLRSLGLDPQRDVSVTPIGGMPEIRGALASGALESATITPPLSFALARAGFTELADLSTREIKYQQGSLVTTRSYLQQQPAIVRRVLGAYAEANRLLLTDKAAAQRVLAKWVEVSDPDELDKTYEIAQRGFRAGPVVDLEAVQTTIDLLAEGEPAVGGLRADQVVDNTVASEAAAQYGFPAR
jgi:NitT/TauT family transport system substrate-binding protein